MRTLIFVVVALCLSAPVSAQSPVQIVTEERAKYTTSQMQDAATVVSFLRGVAARLNAAGFDGYPFGILVKTGGHNCGGYSCDIICSGNGPGQRQWDVLVDAGGASAPTWREVGAGLAVRPCEIVTSSQPVPAPVPTPDPIDLTAVYARLRALENAVEVLHLETRDIRAELRVETVDIRKVIATLPPATIACADLPEYRGKNWTGTVTSRAVCR